MVYTPELADWEGRFMKKRSLILILMVLSLLLPLTSSSAATYYYVSGTSSVKLRESPSTNAAVKDSYRADFTVITYKKYDATWAYVHFSNGEAGYVMRKYLKASSTSTAYVTKDDTALRSGPATSFEKTSTLYQGDKVRVLTSGSTWSYVSGSAGTGYVKKSLLSSQSVPKSGNAGTPYKAYVVNANGRTVNVRRGPGTNNPVDGELAPGTEITVEHVNGSWSQITGPVSGWMMNRYISKTEPEPTPTLEPGTTPTPTKNPEAGKVRYLTAKSGSTVNIRRGPSEKGYAVAIALPIGTKVTLISSENGWSKIKSDKMVGSGYVKNQFLTSRVPGTTATPKPGETPKPTKEPFVSFSSVVINPNDRTVNVRTGPSTSYATITQLNPGTSVTVHDESGSWYKISFDGGSGWMMKDYIK